MGGPLVLCWWICLWLCCSAQQPEHACRDDPTWVARTTRTPCDRLHWNQCSNTRSDERVTAARACAKTCGSCALLVGLVNGTPCVDDSTWRTLNGMSCATIYVLANAMPSYDRIEQCASMRSDNLTAAQACPDACGVCTVNGGASSQSADALAPSSVDTIEDTVEAVPTHPTSSATHLPPDRMIMLRTPVGTKVPVDTTSCDLTGDAFFRTIDIITMGTFSDALQLETVIHIPPASAASMVLPSDVFEASPGVFQIHVFVNVPHNEGGIADVQKLIEVQLLPYNLTSTAAVGEVLSSLPLHLGETGLHSSNAERGDDQRLHGEWLELRSQFQLFPEQLPGRVLLKLHGANPLSLAFGGLGVRRISMRKLSEGATVTSTQSCNADVDVGSATQRSCSTARLVDGVREPGPANEWLVIGPSPERVTLELELPTLSVLCALQSDWLMIEEWALLLSPASRSTVITASTDAQSDFDEVLVVGRNDHPTSPAVRHFDCTSASRARLELRQSNSGQYGLMEITLFGYTEGEDGCPYQCRNGGSCRRSTEGCRCPRYPSCPPFTRGCGWTGRLCTVDIDECAARDFGGCGAHSASAAALSDRSQGDPDRATCTNTPGSYFCDCRAPHWQGSRSESGGNDCVDVDECQSRELNPCEHMCHNDIGGYHCSCRAGFALSSGYKCDALSRGEKMSSPDIPWWTRTFGVDAYVFFTSVSVLGSMCVLVMVAMLIARQHVKENALAEQSQLSETALLLAEIPSDDAYFDDGEDEDLEDFFYGADRSGRRGRRGARQTVRVRMPVVLPPAQSSPAASATATVGDHMGGGWDRYDEQPALKIAQERIPPPPPRTAEIEEYLQKDPRRRISNAVEANH